MEVWVAGATGVLGRHTVPLLLSAGHTVTGLARTPAKWPDAPPEMRFAACDITQPDAVNRAIGDSRPDAILHLATAIPTGRPTPADWARNDAVRREGTANLTEAALRAGAYYIQQSVHYVYTPRGAEWIREDSPIGGSPVMASAIDAESITARAIPRGLRGCIIRPSTLYSADSGQTRALVNGIRSGMPVLVGNGANYWSFVHPRDVGAAIVLLLETQPIGSVYNISDDEPAPMKDCLAWVAERLGVRPPRPIAPFLARAAVGGSTVDLLTGSRRISNAKAREELGWRPGYDTIREGMAAEIARIAP